MQSFSWYLRRLASMSPGEILWRLRGKVRDFEDRILLSSRQQPPALKDILIRSTPRAALAEQILCSGETSGVQDAIGGLPYARFWRERARAQADEILAGRLHLLDGIYEYADGHIDWNFEPKANMATPMDFAADVDYRDYQVTGDCKFVWEPNRHQHLSVLARAYRWTGDERYALAVLNHIESWIRQCPYGLGMNWRSPLELGIRLINWAFALELIAGSHAVTDNRLAHVLASVHQHLGEIDRKFSRYSSANNHLIGEAAGVFIGATYFAGLRNAADWAARAQAVLEAEIIRQIYPDGGTREQTTGYQQFVMQFFMLAGLAARRTGQDFSQAYWARLERMFEFVAALTEGGPLPMFGDADDGFVLDIGDREPGWLWLQDVGAVIFDRGDFVATGAGERIEPVWWLCGHGGCEEYAALLSQERSMSLESKALCDSGHYLLQCSQNDTRPGVSVLVDCGELGFGALAAHGHADALSMVLRINNRDVLVDPGTYDYFTYPKWRSYFRGTKAHNTIVVDVRDQSEMLGPFLWGRRAKVNCLSFEPGPEGGTFVGEHDGYASLNDPVIHRRTVTLNAATAQVVVQDELFAEKRHEVSQYWHFSEECRLVNRDENRFLIDCVSGKLTLEVDPKLAVTAQYGCEESMGGWVSRGYHRRAPALFIRAAAVIEGDESFVTRISAEPRGSESPQARNEARVEGTKLVFGRAYVPAG